MKEITIGTRIRKLREAFTNPEVSQSDLARAVGVTPQAVQKWEAGGSEPRPSKLPKIALALGVPLSELLSETRFDPLVVANEQVNNSSDKPLIRKYEEVSRMQEYFGKLPLISWEHASNWGRVMATGKSEHIQEWLPSPQEHGSDSFIVRIEGEANFDPKGQKSYAPGDYVAIDPAKPLRNRCMALVRLPDEARAVFQQILMEGDVRMLKWLNPTWPNQISVMPDGTEIIGVATGKWVPE